MQVFQDPQFSRTLTFSLAMAVLTIGVSLALIVPTAYWVRLRLRLRPVIEFITLMPFVVPAIVSSLVYRPRVYGGGYAADQHGWAPTFCWSQPM